MARNLNLSCESAFKNWWETHPIYSKLNNFKSNSTEDLQLRVSCRRFKYEPLEWSIHHYQYSFKISTQVYISSITFNLFASILCYRNSIRKNNRARATVPMDRLCFCVLRLVALDTHTDTNEKWNTVASTIMKRSRGVLGNDIHMINSRSIWQNILHLAEKKVLILKVTEYVSWSLRLNLIILIWIYLLYE